MLLHRIVRRPQSEIRDCIVHGALRRVAALLKAGHDWVVDADLKSCFDTISHERLMVLVQPRLSRFAVRKETRHPR